MGIEVEEPSDEEVRNRIEKEQKKIERTKERNGCLRHEEVDFVKDPNVKLGDDAYLDEIQGHPVYRWESNNQPTFLEMIVKADFEEDRLFELAKGCIMAREKSIQKTVEREKNRERTGEEIHEMKAAFGEEAEVVNVLTGDKTDLSEF